MYDPLFRRTPEEVFDEYIKTLYTKLNFCVWLTISVYAVFYFMVGAQFTFYSLLAGALLINPLIHVLNIYQYRNVSRLLFILSSNFYIYMASLGVGHAGRIEYFLIPAAIIPLFIYERHEFKKMLLVTALPVCSWAAINFIDLGNLPGTFHLTHSQNSFLSSVNFVFSQGLAFIFVYIYRQLLGDLQARNIRGTEMQNRELVSNKKFLLQSQLASKIGSWRMDSDFQVTNVTLQTFINMGISAESERISYALFTEQIGENDRKILLNKIVKGQHSLKPFEHSCHIQTVVGVKIVKIIGQWLMDDKQQISLYGCSQDISEIAELELEYSQLKNTLQQGAVFTICEPDGHIIETSEDFTRTYGYTVEELHSKSHNIFDFSLKKDELRSHVLQAAQESKPWMGEVECKNKEGAVFWTQTLIMPIVGLDQTLKKLFFLQFDINQQKKLQTQLIQTSKLTSLGEMAGGMAHEINTPLSIILMRSNLLIDLLKKIPDINPKSFEHLTKIELTTHRIARIVSNLKTFSRNSENDPYQPVQLSAMVTDTLELCQERFKHRGIEVRVDCDDSSYVLGNSIELSQALMNLLSNACDALEKLPEKWIHVRTEHADGQITLSVTDSGSGIDAEIASKMMNPFFTTKVGKGTGLGLGISTEKIKKHGGLLSYDEKSPNTRFVIVLPEYYLEMNSPQTHTG